MFVYSFQDSIVFQLLSFLEESYWEFTWLLVKKKPLGDHRLFFFFFLSLCQLFFLGTFRHPVFLTHNHMAVRSHWHWLTQSAGFCEKTAGSHGRHSACTSWRTKQATRLPATETIFCYLFQVSKVEKLISPKILFWWIAEKNLYIIIESLTIYFKKHQIFLVFKGALQQTNLLTIANSLTTREPASEFLYNKRTC